MMKKELTLSETQTHKVDSVNLFFAKKLDEVMATGDREKMRAAFQTNAEEKEEALKAILTEEQFIKFKEMELRQQPQRPQRL